MALWWEVNMADKLVVVKDNGTCELATLKPYPIVIGTNEVAVTSSTTSTGAVQYVVSASPSVVTNVVGGHRIATHTSGTGAVVDINETVTTLTVSGAGFTYVNEAGVPVNVTICQLAHGLPDNGAIIGG